MLQAEKPEDDPEIYKATSPVFHAEGLEGNLLLVALDDNVLFHVWMIQKLIEAQKYFDLVYPDDHGLTLRHESLPIVWSASLLTEEHMGPDRYKIRKCH